MIRFSVIMTTYNGSATIGATLDSILNQEGRKTDFELEVLLWMITVRIIPSRF
jgi:glycosyltransferase involved in cell wall biosynthesis